jgi:hypothetical protein
MPIDTSSGMTIERNADRDRDEDDHLDQADDDEPPVRDRVVEASPENVEDAALHPSRFRR